MTEQNPTPGIVERQKTLLGEALLAEQKAENAFAPDGRNLNRRAIHASVRAAWTAYDDCTAEIADLITTLQAELERRETIP